MKTQPAKLAAAAAALCLLGTAPLALAQTTLVPAAPLGMLDAYPTVVQTGTKPTLTWGIVYPSNITNVITINPPGTVVVNTGGYVTVQPVGTGVVGCTATPAPVTPAPSVDMRLSYNGSGYDQLFYGTQAVLNPAQKLWIKKVKAGDTINFGGRYVLNGAWTPFYTTLSSNLQVITLVNGSTIPTTLPLYQQSFLAAYLRPYLDATGKIKLSAMSALVLMELNQTDHSQPCFDYQDAVLIISYSSKHPNNGHGNNLDGVDSSNPGQGGGGPNGAVDPSGGVDDEMR